MPPKSARTDLQYRTVRLATFVDGALIGNSKSLRKWRHRTLDANHMADSGFYYTPTRATLDQVTCFWCGKRENNYGDIDSICELHHQNHPLCPYSRITMWLERFLKEGDKTKFWPSVAQKAGSAFADPFSSESIELRVSTFKTLWKLDSSPNSNVTSRQLAEAGFYYSPVETDDDRVICMYCDCPLLDWSVDDDPMNEHIKNRFEYCYFLEKYQEQRNAHNTKDAVLTQKTSTALEKTSSILPTETTTSLKGDEPVKDAFDFSIEELQDHERGTIFEGKDFLPKRFSRRLKQDQRKTELLRQPKKSMRSESPERTSFLWKKSTELRLTVQEEIEHSKAKPEDNLGTISESLKSVFTSNSQKSYEESASENTSEHDSPEKLDSDPSFHINDSHSSIPEKRNNSIVKPLTPASKKRKTQVSKKRVSQFDDDDDFGMTENDLERILNSPKKAKKVKVVQKKEAPSPSGSLYDNSNQNLGDYEEDNLSFLETNIKPSQLLQGQAEKITLTPLKVFKPKALENAAQTQSRILPSDESLVEVQAPTEATQEQNEPSVQEIDSKGPQEISIIGPDSSEKHPTEKDNSATPIISPPSDHKTPCAKLSPENNLEIQSPPRNIPAIKLVARESLGKELSAGEHTSNGRSMKETSMSEAKSQPREESKTPELEDATTTSGLQLNEEEEVFNIDSIILENSPLKLANGPRLSEKIEMLKLKTPAEDASAGSTSMQKLHGETSLNNDSQQNLNSQKTDDLSIIKDTEEDMGEKLAISPSSYRDYQNDLQEMDFEFVDEHSIGKTTTPSKELVQSENLTALTPKIAGASSEMKKSVDSASDTGLKIQLDVERSDAPVSETVSVVAGDPIQRDSSAHGDQIEATEKLETSYNTKKCAPEAPLDGNLLHNSENFARKRSIHLEDVDKVQSMIKKANESEDEKAALAKSWSPESNAKEKSPSPPSRHIYQNNEMADLAAQNHTKSEASFSRLSFDNVEASTPHKGESTTASAIETSKSARPPFPHINLEFAKSQIRLLEEAIERMSELSATKFKLHNDADGYLTEFIAAMPEKEESMSIQDWILENSLTCEQTVKAISALIIDTYLKDFDKLIAYSEEMATID
ncbi:hypothetical protein PUMCH_003295 [Australozyma saopauloensis]|uniref:Protein bir1 n=1 Tax=Australozyma saopauloensis TaxID=291208 RepID=A0AAX4HC88_9ASCO|nr:hypothetical protein PUMCH_003295 [[Candida] saopauloensis]